MFKYQKTELFIDYVTMDAFSDESASGWMCSNNKEYESSYIVL